MSNCSENDLWLIPFLINLFIPVFSSGSRPSVVVFVKTVT